MFAYDVYVQLFTFHKCAQREFQQAIFSNVRYYSHIGLFLCRGCINNVFLVYQIAKSKLVEATLAQVAIDRWQSRGSARTSGY